MMKRAHSYIAGVNAKWCNAYGVEFTNIWQNYTCIFPLSQH